MTSGFRQCNAVAPKQTWSTITNHIISTFIAYKQKQLLNDAKSSQIQIKHAAGLSKIMAKILWKIKKLSQRQLVWKASNKTFIINMSYRI